NASTTNGTQMDIWTTNTSSAQSWKLVYDYDGYYKLKPKCAPSSCLNVSGNNPNNGSSAILWQESNGDNERWVLQVP
ncbi:RICIN domain-containing protein, partial [Chitinophaga sp.]|uniref:RICIN domain-containing protein n=1 Tax=Chitinophaga sp. TaxID=1869181 RepID=UPI002F95ACF7